MGLTPMRLAQLVIGVLVIVIVYLIWTPNGASQSSLQQQSMFRSATPTNDALSTQPATAPPDSEGAKGTKLALAKLRAAREAAASASLDDARTPPTTAEVIANPDRFLSSEVAALLAEASGVVPDRIPKIVHFIHGLKDVDVKFTFIHFLAIKAAKEFIKPDHIFFHHLNLPDANTNPWWTHAAKLVTLKPARSVTHVFGNPVTHFAHKADVLRLEVLLKYGGIYLDIDVIALQSFDPLLGYEMVLGEEKKTDSEHPHGLGNGVIIARRTSVFLKEWYKGYRNFDSTKWSHMSIQFPKQLAQTMHPTQIKILPPTAFYTPCWDGKAAKMFYERNDYDLSNNLAVHVWSSDKQRVSGPEDICFLNNLFGRILRIAYQSGEPTEENQCPPGALHNQPTFNTTSAA